MSVSRGRRMEGAPRGSMALGGPFIALCVTVTPFPPSPQTCTGFQPARAPPGPQGWKRPQGTRSGTSAPKLKSLSPARGNGYLRCGVKMKSQMGNRRSRPSGDDVFPQREGPYGAQE